jgi:serine/threonine protein kinase
VYPSLSSSACQHGSRSDSSCQALLPNFAKLGGTVHVSFRLQAVHACGLAHCDIKPENIMLSKDGAPKLCDFGASVAIDQHTGKVAAMPPEISELEQQMDQLTPPGMHTSVSIASSDRDRATPAALSPYSLRKVTQVRPASS